MLAGRMPVSGKINITTCLGLPLGLLWRGAGQIEGEIRVA